MLIGAIRRTGKGASKASKERIMLEGIKDEIEESFAMPLPRKRRNPIHKKKGAMMTSKIMIKVL